MHKVILDTDPGVDDTMAIAYALAHPEIELLALTTVFGNINIDYATRNAQYVLEMLGAQNVSVAKGAETPSIQTPLPHADFVHGTDGLGNVYPGSEPGIAAKQSATLNQSAKHTTLDRLDAADYIVDAVREYPHQITLVAVGPMTNIAEALRREPDLPSMVAGLVIMGGTVDEPGNVSPVAEANFVNDPHAADAVLAADWPASVVGLDVTHQIMIGDSHLARLRDEARATGELIWSSSRFYVDFYTKKGAASEAAAQGAEPQCAMHDAAAIAYLVMPDAFTVISGAARVIPDGIAIGQLALDRKGYAYPIPHWQNRPATHVCMAVDAERVRQDFLRTIIDHHIR